MENKIVKMGNIINALQVFTNSKLCDIPSVGVDNIEYITSQLANLESLQKVIESEFKDFISLQEHEESLKDLKSKIVDQDKVTELLSSSNLKLGEAESKINKLEKEKTDLELEIAKLKESNSDLQFKIDTFNTSDDISVILNTVMEKINTIQDDSITIKNNMIDIKNSIGKSNENYSESLSILKSYSKSIEVIDSKVEGAIKDTKEQKSVFEKVIDNYNKTLDSITRNEECIKELKSESSSNKEVVSNIKEEVNNTTVKVEDLTNKVKKNTSFLEKLKGLFHD